MATPVTDGGNDDVGGSSGTATIFSRMVKALRSASFSPRKPAVGEPSSSAMAPRSGAKVDGGGEADGTLAAGASIDERDSEEDDT